MDSKWIALRCVFAALLCQSSPARPNAHPGRFANPSPTPDPFAPPYPEKTVTFLRHPILPRQPVPHPGVVLTPHTDVYPSRSATHSPSSSPHAYLRHFSRPTKPQSAPNIPQLVLSPGSSLEIYAHRPRRATPSPTRGTDPAARKRADAYPHGRPSMRRNISRRVLRFPVFQVGKSSCSMASTCSEYWPPFATPPDAPTHTPAAPPRPNPTHSRPRPTLPVPTPGAPIPRFSPPLLKYTHPTTIAHEEPTPGPEILTEFARPLSYSARRDTRNAQLGRPPTQLNHTECRRNEQISRCSREQRLLGAPGNLKQAIFRSARVDTPQAVSYHR